MKNIILLLCFTGLVSNVISYNVLSSINSEEQTEFIVALKETDTCVDYSDQKQIPDKLSPNKIFELALKHGEWKTAQYILDTGYVTTALKIASDVAMKNLKNFFAKSDIDFTREELEEQILYGTNFKAFLKKNEDVLTGRA
jgi:hypothetical protein